MPAIRWTLALAMGMRHGQFIFSVLLATLLLGGATGAKAFSKTASYDSENQLTNATIANKFKKDFVYDGLYRF